MVWKFDDFVVKGLRGEESCAGVFIDISVLFVLSAIVHTCSTGSESVKRERVMARHEYILEGCDHPRRVACVQAI